jgi:hypothetical protein
MAGENPSALVRLWNELKAQSPDADDMILSGIYVAKTGYHNTREHHEEDTHGGNPTDYSIRLDRDKQGSRYKAAAIDITFKTAQAGKFHVIAKYSLRLLNAMRNRDPRIFYKGKPVIREFFGNSDLDWEVEGWTMHRTSTGQAGPASSDKSHLYHIHKSYFRDEVDNWDAVKGILDILLGKPIVEPEEPTPPPVEDEVTPEEIESIARRAADLVWFKRLTNPESPPGATPPHASEYLVGQGNEIDMNLKPRLTKIEADVAEILRRLPPPTDPES